MPGMPGPLFDREAIEAEIDRVRSLGVDSLRTLWRTTFRSSPPPAFSKGILARSLCWHIQEQAFGGLDPKTAKHLDGLARGDRSRADRPRRLKPGTVLLREYQGGDTPSPSLQRAMSGARRLMPASPASRELSPVRPGTARVFLVSGIDKGTAVSPDRSGGPGTRDRRNPTLSGS